VQAVVQAAADEVPVAAREAEDEQRRVGDVGHGVGHRHLRGQRGARLLGADRLVRDDEDRLQAGGSVERVARVGGPGSQITKPPSSAAATLSG